MASFLRPRRGKRATAISQNIILKKGEVFFEVPDSGVGKGLGKIKLGDGTTGYNSLPYFLEPTDVDAAGITFTEATSTNNTTLLNAIASGASLSTIVGNTKKMLRNLNSSVTSLNTEVDGSIKNASVSGRVITFTKNNGSTFKLTTQDTNTTYSNYKGASSSSAGIAGLVPPASTSTYRNFLRGDGTWAVPSNASTAEYAINASTASYASNAGSAGYANNAGTSSYSNTAGVSNLLKVTRTSNPYHQDLSTQRLVVREQNPSSEGAPTSHWYHVITTKGEDARYATQLAMGFEDLEIYFRQMNVEKWSNWRRILNSTNYNEYAPSLTGSGASGTWNINVTGTASTATYAHGANEASYANRINLPRQYSQGDYNEDLPGAGRISWREFTTGSVNGPGNYFYHVFTGHSADTNFYTQLALGMTTDHIAYRRVDYGNSSGWHSVITDKNYGSYTEKSHPMTFFYSSEYSTYADAIFAKKAEGYTSGILCADGWHPTDMPALGNWSTVWWRCSCGHSIYSIQLYIDRDISLWLGTLTSGENNNQITWSRVYTNKNKPSASDIGAASSSHTHNYAGSSSAGGAANSAVKLQTARTISLTGDVTGSASFDGSKNITITTKGVGEREHDMNTDGCYFEADLTASTYDQNTWYPIVGPTLPTGGYTKISCNVQLDDTSHPSWATHGNGFVCNFTIYAKAAGWGTTGGESYVTDWFYSWCDKNPLGYQQMTNSSHPVIFARGGGLYPIRSSEPLTWTVYSTTFTDEQESVSPTTTEPSVIFTRATIHAHLSGNVVGNVTGNATSATQLQTARTINGTSFNGTANITTANWGTARTIKIGNTGKSVNGSNNVTWSLSEIGAAASSHTHPASQITAGALPVGVTATNSTDYTTSRVRNARFGTSAPSSLANGEIFFVYE